MHDPQARIQIDLQVRTRGLEQGICSAEEYEGVCLRAVEEWIAALASFASVLFPFVLAVHILSA